MVNSSWLATWWLSSSLTHGLFRRGVVVVELAAEQGQPLTQIEHAVIHEVTGPALDHENPLVREVLGQARGYHAACGAAADDHIVIAVTLGGGDICGGHPGDPKVSYMYGLGRVVSVGLSEELTSLCAWFGLGPRGRLQRILWFWKLFGSTAKPLARRGRGTIYLARIYPTRVRVLAFERLILEVWDTLLWSVSVEHFLWQQQPGEVGADSSGTAHRLK